MLTHRRYWLTVAAQAAFWLATSAPAFAFDDRAFCVAAQQFAFAADKDIDLWIDRTTRNGGMAVSCDAKSVEFRRFSYASSGTLNTAWKERETQVFNSTHCNNPIWKDAIANGWQIRLTVTATDGARVSVDAQCKSSTH